MSRGKLTVANCNPSVQVILPSHAIGGFPGDAEPGAIAWDAAGGNMYLFAPTDEGGAIWQKIQRQ